MADHFNLAIGVRESLVHFWNLMSSLFFDATERGPYD
jgi:hypothetical protein